jgi:hypothetical protein
MAPGLNKLTLALVAAVANGISTSQSLGAAGNLTITGSLATAGVATFDVARRVGIVSAGNDSGMNWTITGTDRNGRPQSETIAGANVGTAQTTRDFLTVSQIAGSAATASTVTAGTTGVASTAPIIMDYFVNPAIYRADVSQVGTANWSIEESIDDISPNYDLTTTSPDWFTETAFAAQSAAARGTLTGPLTMVRLTINSGTGAVTARIATPFVAGMA